MYCLYRVFVLFRLCIFILICFVCTSVRPTATEWKLNCSNNNNNTNNNINNSSQLHSPRKNPCFQFSKGLSVLRSLSEPSERQTNLFAVAGTEPWLPCFISKYHNGEKVFGLYCSTLTHQISGNVDWGANRPIHIRKKVQSWVYFQVWSCDPVHIGRAVSPWSIKPLQKLTVTQIVQKLFSFCDNRKVKWPCWQEQTICCYSEPD
jgi:hypothetical protein